MAGDSGFYFEFYKGDRVKHMKIAIGLLIPFLGTTMGAACVLFLKNELHRLVQKTLMGIAAGVMVAASVWSLLLPAISMSEQTMGKLAFVPPAVGFACGIFFCLPRINSFCGCIRGELRSLREA